MMLRVWLTAVMMPGCISPQPVRSVGRSREGAARLPEEFEAADDSTDDTLGPRCPGPGDSGLRVEPLPFCRSAVLRCSDARKRCARPHRATFQIVKVMKNRQESTAVEFPANILGTVSDAVRGSTIFCLRCLFASPIRARYCNRHGRRNLKPPFDRPAEGGGHRYCTTA